MLWNTTQLGASVLVCTLHNRSRTQQNMSGRVALPNIDEVAKKWEVELSRRVGLAVQARRKALGLTAQQLAERTKDFDYHVTRVAISKIEGNLRAGKLDVAELLVLAVALDIPPALLVFPGFPEGSVEVVPGRTADSGSAVKWLGGRSSDRQVAPDNDGTTLVEAVTERPVLANDLFELQKRRDDGSLTGKVFDVMFEERNAKLATTEERIALTRDQLWGTGVAELDTKLAEGNSDG
jgi:transcriptional regulator with XRE-family HTH domain